MPLEVAPRRLVERTLDLGIEDDSTGRRDDELAVPRVLDRVLVVDGASLERELDLLLCPEPLETLRADGLRGLRGRQRRQSCSQYVRK